MCRILNRFFIIIAIVFTLCSCSTNIKSVPEQSPETIAVLTEQERQTVETEYYKSHERLDGCKLYISNEKMCLQIPENAKVLHQGNISFTENNEITQFSARANAVDALPEYQSEADIIQSYESEGLHLKGELTGFQVLYDDNGAKTGYEYLQKVRDDDKTYATLYRMFYKNGIMCRLDGTFDLNSNDAVEKIRKYFDTVDIYGE